MAQTATAQAGPAATPQQTPHPAISHVLVYVGGIIVPQINLLRNQLAFLNQPSQPQQGITHLPANRVLLILSSWGGNVFEARSVYGLIRSLPFPVEVHATGAIKSAAVPLMLACDHRSADPNTTFFFHPWTWGLEANASHTIQELQQFPSQLEDDIAWGKRVLKERTKLAQAQIDDFFRESHIEDAAFALTHGIVQDVRERQMPRGVMTWNVSQ